MPQLQQGRNHCNLPSGIALKLEDGGAYYRRLVCSVEDLQAADFDPYEDFKLRFCSGASVDVRALSTPMLFRAWEHRTYLPRILDDAQLVIEVLADLTELILFEGDGPRILFHAIAGEHLYIDNRTVHA